jgi:hypothetical protein
MDKIEKLKALAGEDEVYANAPHDWDYALKPAHIYEGTDSEDDELVTSRKSEKKAGQAVVGNPIHTALGKRVLVFLCSFDVPLITEA